MGTITAASIIDSAAFALQDEGNTRWTRAELLGYVNDGQRDLCVVKPDACTVNELFTPVAGTKQSMPAGAAGLVRVVRNMGTSGTSAGKVPRRIDLDVLDAQDPNWHSRSSSATVAEYGYDERDPTVFYVSPPQPATGQGKLELAYFGTPAELADETDTIVLEDIYQSALMHYVVYRAYMKEGEYSNPAGYAAHRAEFLALLGAKNTAEAGVA